MQSGVLVAIRRATFRSGELGDVRRAMEVAAAAHPRGLVMLTAVRLSPVFPVDVGSSRSLSELAETVRFLDRVLVANATVVELGGIRAAALRLVSRATWQLAGLRGALGHFDRLSDAIGFLIPHARAIGASDDPATYVQLYRHVERELAALDAEHWAREPQRGSDR